MPVLDVSNPRVINFLLENYEKESRIRMKWVKNHTSQIAQAAKLTREETNYTREDIIKVAMEAGMAATTRDHISGARNKTTAALPDYALVKTDVIKTEMVSMKPVTTDLKDVLLESSREYLKKRNLLKPEDKYNFIECSYWKYGWKLDESMLKASGPEYGKVNHVMRMSRCRVGPQRDPDHYNAPDPGQKVFNDI